MKTQVRAVDLFEVGIDRALELVDQAIVENQALRAGLEALRERELEAPSSATDVPLRLRRTARSKKRDLAAVIEGILRQAEKPLRALDVRDVLLVSGHEEGAPDEFYLEVVRILEALPFLERLETGAYVVTTEEGSRKAG